MKIDVTFTVNAKVSGADSKFFQVTIENKYGECLLTGHLTRTEWEAFRDGLQPCSSADFVIKEETCK